MKQIYRNSFITRFLVTLLCVASFSNSILLAAPIDKARSEAPNCGILSVLNFARHAGKNLDKAKIKALYERYPQPQVTMDDVRQAAEQLGIHLVGVQISLHELERRRQPFIAVAPNHFVFVELVENGWIRYLEDATKTGGWLTMPRKDFAARYLGFALILKPNPKINVLSVWPRIIVDKDIPYGIPSRTFSVTLANNGTQPLDIENISTSCSCTVPSTPPPHLNPGQKVNMKIQLSMSGERTFSQAVFIKTNGFFPYQTIWLRGEQELDVNVVPGLLNFGTVIVQKTQTQTLRISDPQQKLPRPFTIKSESSLLKTQLKTIDKNTWIVEVTLNAPPKPYDLESDLLIGGTKLGERVIHIPVRAHLVPMVKSTPDQVVFGSVTSQTKSRHIEIFRQDQQPLEIVSLRAPSYLTCEFHPNDENHRVWTLTVAINHLKASGQISDNIEVLTRGAKQLDTLKIPVIGLVESARSTVTPSLQEAMQLPAAEAIPEIKIGIPLPTVKVQDEAPDFRVFDANGNPWHLKALRGRKNVLITFFPKCFTGGCTTQLVSLRDAQQEFETMDTQIIAVSVDPAEGPTGQKAFIQQWRFPFPLVPDTSRELCKLYGATQHDNDKAARLTYLIDKQGIVRYIDTAVDVKTHASDVLDHIKALKLQQ